MHYATAVAAAAGLLMAAPASAGFKVRQVIIHGTTSVAATGLNNHGDIGGNVLDPVRGYVPFVRMGGTVTILPKKPVRSPLGNHWAYPWVTSINDSGAVAGYIFEPSALTYFSVLFSGGRYHKAYHRALAAYPENDQPPAFPPLINDGGYMSFTYLGADLAQGTVLRAHGKDWTTGGCDNLNFISSVNDAGVAAGACSNFNPADPPVVYTQALATGEVTTLLPPNATQATGGYINNAGAVAGTFQDENGSHGFIWQAGVYTTLDGPGTSGGLSLYALNDNGRAAGMDTDPSTQQPRIDYYNGSTVVALPVPAAGTSFSLVLNNRNTMLYSTSSQGTTATSYLITCTGQSC